MKRRTAALAVFALTLIGCRLANKAVEGASTLQAGSAAPITAEKASPIGQADENTPQGAEPSPQGEALGGLEDDWRPVYSQGALLFEICVVAHQTHSDYAKRAIALERAQAELEVEAEFASYVWRDITSVQPQDESAASHLLENETQAMALAELLVTVEEAIGSPETLASLDSVCSALQEQMDAIVADATSAGVGSASFDEFDNDIALMLEDLYARTTLGR